MYGVAPPLATMVIEPLLDPQLVFATVGTINGPGNVKFVVVTIPLQAWLIVARIV